MISTPSFITNHFAANAVVNCGGGTCNTGLPSVHATSSNLQSGVTVVFAVVGVIAVLMVALGGLQLILAQGDPQAMARARQTIIYAIAGLVVAISAEAIVAFVLGKF